MTLAERFWAKVAKADAKECWLWAGTVEKSGYGRAWSGRDRKNRLAHRMAYELAFGAIPSGSHYGTTCVCHRCDNMLCCNPSHLFLGTHAENMADMVSKGRQRFLSGENNKACKLTDHSVRDIVANHLLCRVSQRELANRFGVSQATVHRIVTLRKRAHV